MNNKLIIGLNLTSSVIWALVATSNFFTGNNFAGWLNLMACILHGLTAGLYFKQNYNKKVLALEKAKNTALLAAMAKPKEKVFDFFR